MTEDNVIEFARTNGYRDLGPSETRWTAAERQGLYVWDLQGRADLALSLSLASVSGLCEVYRAAPTYRGLKFMYNVWFREVRQAARVDVMVRARRALILSGRKRRYIWTTAGMADLNELTPAALKQAEEVSYRNAAAWADRDIEALQKSRLQRRLERTELRDDLREALGSLS